MPKSPNPNLNPDQLYNLTVRIPGWMKQQIIELCEEHGWSLQEWVSVRLLVDLWEGRGVPLPPRGVCPLPSSGDVLRVVLSGEGGRLFGPCGGVWPCGFVGGGSVVVGGVEFCSVCDVRVVVQQVVAEIAPNQLP